MKLIGKAAFTATVAIAMLSNAHRAIAVPLLAVDFGAAENYVQPGFGGMEGAVGQSTANASFGIYTVDLATFLANPNQTSSRGFGTSTAGHAAAIAQSVRSLYRDYFYNDSDISGDGITLTIGGVTPSATYNLTLWSYDGDQSFSSTNTLWGPLDGGSTTGGSGSVTNFALPRPTSLSDNSTTIQINSSSGALEIRGTTTSGFGGTRLNGFRLNDGVNDVLSVDLGQPSPPPSPVQSGFQSMAGTFPIGDNSPPPSATATFGSYTVTVSGDPYQGTDYTRVGFEDNAAGASGIDASIRPLYEDGLNNNLDLNDGSGLNLAIQGVVPNAKYALKVWSYNPDNTFYATPTQFSPRTGTATSGTTSSIIQIASPLPTTLDDYSTTIAVSSTTNTLEIHAASTANFGGTRLNAFELSLLGDYNGDGKVNGADYVVWRKTDGTPAGYDAWRSNFGAGVGSGSGSVLGSAVPEPSSLMAVIVGALLCSTHRRYIKRDTKLGAAR